MVRTIHDFQVDFVRFNCNVILKYDQLLLLPTLCKENRAMNLMQMFLLACSTAKAVALAH